MGRKVIGQHKIANLKSDLIRSVLTSDVNHGIILPTGLDDFGTCLSFAISTVAGRQLQGEITPLRL